MMDRVTTKLVIIGQRVERLVVLGQVGINPPQMLCQCDCGNQVVVHAGSLVLNKQGHRSGSCGCRRREGSQPVHGMCDTPEYNAWHSMKDRCLRPAHRIID